MLRHWCCWWSNYSLARARERWRALSVERGALRWGDHSALPPYEHYYWCRYVERLRRHYDIKRRVYERYITPRAAMMPLRYWLMVIESPHLPSSRHYYFRRHAVILRLRYYAILRYDCLRRCYMMFAMPLLSLLLRQSFSATLLSLMIIDTIRHTTRCRSLFRAASPLLADYDILFMIVFLHYWCHIVCSFS